MARPPGALSRRAKRTRAEATDPRQLRQERHDRAVREPLEVQLDQLSPFLTLQIRNPVHRSQYWVLLPVYPEPTGAFCACEDFARRGLATCKHLEAAWMWLAAHPPPPAPPEARPLAGALWNRIDRELGRLSVSKGPRARRFRAPGRLLFAAPRSG